jgi:hypothetical protein
VIEFRLYRVAFLPAIAVVIAVAFSLEGVPEPLLPELSPAGFEPTRALGVARQIVEAAPSRAPGSEGDRASAAIVERSFSDVSGGTISEQDFGSNYAGEDVSLRNVILTLPGESDRSIVVLAARDSPVGPGAASSAAATGVLVELARALGAFDHTKTLVLVSTDGAGDGASGARQFADSFEEIGGVDAVVVLSQPGSRHRRQPFVVGSSTGDQNTSIQLVRTAQHAVEEATGETPELGGVLSGLARLALPAGLGEQAVLIEHGLDAVAISSAGEAPLPVADDGLDDLSVRSLGDFGGAAFSTVLALDARAEPPEHGPDSYLIAGGNLLPGGPLSFLALALLVPAAVVAVDSLARASRRRLGVPRALSWTVALALPLLVGLLAIYLMALLGLVPRPGFPFAPAQFAVGPGEIVAMLVPVALAVGSFAMLRLLSTPHDVAHEALPPALGGMLVVGGVLAWLANPFLALLLAPVAHVWILPLTRRPPSTAAMAAAVTLSLLPFAIAAIYVCATLGLDPWDLTLMVSDGQIGAVVAVAACLVLAGLAGLVANSRAGRSPHVGSSTS